MKTLVLILFLFFTSTLHVFADMQDDRWEFIEGLVDKGVFQKVEVPSKYPHLWVRPAFLRLDFSMKKDFVNVVFAFYVTNGTITKRSGLIVLYDSRTGKKVGVYGEAYGGLKIY